MILGWGPIQENPVNSAWYIPVKPKLKCAHCGSYVKAITNKPLKYISYASFISAYYFFINGNNFEYADLFIGIALIFGIATFITGSLLRKYEVE